jgi:hypothetical protein
MLQPLQTRRNAGQVSLRILPTPQIPRCAAAPRRCHPRHYRPESACVTSCTLRARIRCFNASGDVARPASTEYRKIKRPFPLTTSAHPMPLCSRWCPRLASARTPRAAHPGEHPTRACPRRPAPPGATPRRRARTGRVAGDGRPARLEGIDSNAMRAVKEASVPSPRPASSR